MMDTHVSIPESLSVTSASGNATLHTTSLRRSCEACRLSKGRCIPGKEDSRRCQRCSRDGKPCIFEYARARPKRAKTSRTRVAEMEQRLDGIVALLTSGNKAVPAQSGSSSSQNDSLNDSESFERIVDYMDPNMSQMNTPPSVNPSSLIQWPPSNQMFPVPELQFDDSLDVIGKGILGLDDAEDLLQFFRSHEYRFPFIVIPSHISLHDLRRERPFLLLAILAMAAHPRPGLQDRLETEFRESFSLKVIVNCEKSLDLLQGLLVYIAWYHFHFRPYRHQMYQFSQMAVAMAVDLEITTPPRSGKHGLSTGPSIRDVPLQHYRVSASNEVRRTYLGCYYLASSLAIGFRRPTSIKFDKYSEDCCQSLMQVNEFPTDRLIPCLTHLQSLCDDVRNTFDYDSYNHSPPMTAARAEILLNTFTTRLDQLERRFHPEVSSFVGPMSAYCFSRIYINELGFHAVPPSFETLSASSTSNEWYSSPTRTDTLIRCLEATKSCFDHFLKVFPRDLRKATITEAITLVYAILILRRFTSGVDAPNLDPTDLRKLANLGHYLDSIVKNMDSFVTIVNGEEYKDYFWHFRAVFQYTQHWYSTQIVSGKFSTLGNKSKLDTSEFAFLKILDLEDKPLYQPQIICEIEPQVLQPPPQSHYDTWTDLMTPWSMPMNPEEFVLNRGAAPI